MVATLYVVLVELIVILPDASLTTVVAPDPIILWELVGVVELLSKWFINTLPLLAAALADAVALAPTIFLEV